MTDPNDTRDTVTTPIQPTGSGVVDLEIAREQDALAEDETAVAPTDVTAVDESEGHPS